MPNDFNFNCCHVFLLFAIFALKFLIVFGDDGEQLISSSQLEVTTEHPILGQMTSFTTFYTTFYLTCIFRASEKIFPDLDENLPLGVVFCVDHESDIIFSIRDRDHG